MSKAAKLSLTIIALAAVLLAFNVGYRLGGRAAQVPEGLPLVNKAWDILSRDYVEQSRLDPAALSQGAIEGMVKALDDPYTSYLNPENYRLTLSGLHGEFEGIGATVGVREDQITIIAPIAGSPAERAGIKPGDIIKAVDGQSVEGMGLTEVVLKIRGPKGTTVKLLVLHLNETQPVEIDIVRDTVALPSVMSEMKGDIGYIYISQFADRTDEDVTSALENFQKQGAKGLIIDLRHNPGGFLESVVDVASHFIKSGVVVKVKSNQEQFTVHEVRPGRLSTDLPIVVLVDGGSASGSEVLSGALQDYGRATIAGSKTFGKGSVNVLRQFDSSGLYVTTARWLTPNGRLIEGQGIEPDVQLDPEADAIQWAIDYLKK